MPGLTPRDYFGFIKTNYRFKPARRREDLLRFQQYTLFLPRLTFPHSVWKGTQEPCGRNGEPSLSYLLGHQMLDQCLKTSGTAVSIIFRTFLYFYIMKATAPLKDIPLACLLDSQDFLFLHFVEPRHVQVSRVPHFVEAICLSSAAASMSANFPSGKLPTTLIHLRISMLIRSMGLFVRIHRQCCGGNL